ncbi:MAG TPA: protein kinase [Polyangiaceae bacterium]|nr:protein kinase [Polyangiaceae bacterium]
MSDAALATEPPKVADRYTLLSLLGKGGMASVYRAYDESLRRTVALKRLTSTAPESAALFEEEFHTLAGLQHRAIVEVYDYGVDADGAYYTMELLDGGDVAALAPMPWQEVCACLRDVGGALALVHRRELVHRDISPRNVWRTARGDFKLLDFGALAKFGKPENIVGTPAFMAPESAAGAPLDQRSDLFSLGAMAYYLLTGLRPHAAYKVEDVLTPHPKALPPSTILTTIKTKPEPPSDESKPASVATELPAIPAELDELVMSLLSRAPLARPFTAAEVIERAGAIAGFTADARVRSKDPQLLSTQFVGREREAKLIADAIVELGRGKGGALLVEGSVGQGKSRLLREASLEARLTGVTVLSVEARLFSGFNRGAAELSLRLLEALPDLSRTLAAAHASILGLLSPEVRDKLGEEVARVPAFATPGEARMRIQDALLAWFTAVGAQEKLAVFVDDVDELDESSAAFVASLARAAGASMLIVASRTTDDGRAPSDPVVFLHGVSRRVPLSELSLTATRALLRSAFGDAPNLPRLAEKLHERSRGNPQHCMDLTQHLVKEGVILHHGGTWILPSELREEQVPSTFAAVVERRFERLSTVAKSITAILLLHGGSLSVAMLCGLLPDEQPGHLSAAVDELLLEGVASGTRTAFRFVNRYAPYVKELSPERAKQVHAKLAEAILARAAFGPKDEIEAGLHLLKGGAEERGRRLLASGSIELINQTEALPDVIPILEEVLSLYRRENRPIEEIAAILGPLATAAYYSDHRLAGKYGDDALVLFQRLFRLDLVARLRRFIGRRLALFVAIAATAIQLSRAAKTGRAPNLKQAFAVFFGVVATLTGVYVIYIDRETALRTVSVLEPLTALGKNHVASFVYEFSRNLVMTIDNASGQAREAWRRMLDRLRSEEPIVGLPPVRRQLYLGGALYACGVIETWADGPAALRMAEELDAMGMKLYEMSADQVRALYYANQGVVDRLQHYRERVETHAIQRGTAWQVEIWWHGAMIATHLRDHDAMGMKHTRDVLERVSADIPSLSLYARRARGAYLVMRGRHREAIAELEATRTASGERIVGANRTIAVLARAYNSSGNPARARALCEATLASMTEADRDLVVMNQLVETELAIAEARLEDYAAAERRLDALIERHLPAAGPLTLGTLYETRMHVALLRNDSDTAKAYYTQMASWYEKTGLPSLAARAELLLSRLAPRSDENAPPPAMLPDMDDVSETMILTD